MEGRLAQEVFDALLDSASSPRTHRSLNNIWAALEHLRASASTDYSYKNVADTIARLAGERGERPSPVYQSIRNDEQGRFKPLIDAYRAQFEPIPGGRPSTETDLLATIPDKHTAARVRTILAENKSLRNNLNRLKELYKQLEFQDFIGGVRGERGAGMGPTGEKPASLSGITQRRLLQPVRSSHFDPEEIEAVRRFVGRLDELDLFLTEAGALHVRTTSGQSWEFVGPGFGQALHKIIAGES